MLKQLEIAEQKWGGSSTMIDHWLNHRRNLLIGYCQIAGLPPYDSSHQSLPASNSIKEFCELLVDYVSEGHFEVYDRVVGACETSGQPTQTLSQSIVPKITETTTMALDFNDKYTNTQDDRVLYQFDKDLSELGHTMEVRFELEDRLLESLHQQ